MSGITFVWTIQDAIGVALFAIFLALFGLWCLLVLYYKVKRCLFRAPRSPSP